MLKDIHYRAENSTAANVLHENFNKLAQARYIERCPAHEPFLEPPEQDAKKRTSRSKVITFLPTITSQLLLNLYLLLHQYKI